MSLDEEDRRTIYKMSGQLDSLVNGLNRHYDDDTRRFGNLDTAIDKLHGKVKWFSGAWAVAALVFAYFMKGGH